jgi:hypothetical protein
MIAAEKRKIVEMECISWTAAFDGLPPAGPIGAQASGAAQSSMRGSGLNEKPVA